MASNPREIRETTKAYRAEIKKLAEEVMDENLRLDKGYNCTSSALRSATTHPALARTLSMVSAPTPMLAASSFQDDEVAGLQILKDGQWIDVQPLANSIVINTGDQIEVLSNGRYKSVWHCVLPTPDGNRRSIASFYNPATKAIIGPVSAAQSATEVAVPAASYPDFLFGDYIDIYVKQKFLIKEPRFQAVEAT